MEVEPRLTALPSVTATAKPAISPAASELAGGEGFETVVKANGSKVTAQLLRRVVGDAGFQVLGELKSLEILPGAPGWSREASTQYGHDSWVEGRPSRRRGA